MVMEVSLANDIPPSDDVGLQMGKINMWSKLTNSPVYLVQDMLNRMHGDLAYTLMERLLCLIFKVFSLLFSSFKSLWTKVSCCVQKATRRVHYIGQYQHLIGRYGRIATRYVHNTACYA